VSVSVTACLNPVSGERSFLAADPGTIADIITKLDCGFPLSSARVCLNGEIVTDFSVRAEDGDELAVKFVPQNAGGVMKVGGWVLAAVGIALLCTPFSGVGAVLIGTGVSLALGGTVLMNVNIPSIPSLKDREKPENDPSIRGGKNQARPGGRIPVLFGRRRIYPDLAANPHTQIINGKQYYTQLFCGGYKDCILDLTSFKLGETPLVELSQTKDINQILSGADPLVRMELLLNGEASSLYPRCVHEDMINAELKNLIEDGGGYKVSGAVIRSTPDTTDSINVDIFFHNGLGQYNDKGDMVSASVEVRASYKPAGASDASYAPLGHFEGGTDAVSGAELKTKRCQITKSGLAPGQYTVKIERVTPDSTDSKVIDLVYVGSIRSVKSSRPIRAERQKDLAVIALRLMATSRVTGVVDCFNYVATSKLPVWSGGSSGENYWLSTAETRNPASMLLCALRGRAAQQRVAAEDIDWPSIEAFYSWCKEHKYYCDAYLSESFTIAELLRMIGSTARADILRIDSKIAVVQDIERPSPLQLFTPKNTKSYSVTMFNADIPDAVSLRFIDEDSGYTQNETQVYNSPDGNKKSEPETVQKIDLWGVTSRSQAWRIGRYNYGCMTHRPFVHTIEADIEYLLVNKGDWIQYAGDIALTGSVQGRIAEMLWSEDLRRYVGIRVDEPLETEPGKNYAVRVRLKNGTVLLKDVAVTREPDEVYFTEPFDADCAPFRGDLYAFGIRGKEVLDLVITDIQPQADLSATLTCVEYSPDIFNLDDPDYLLPPFENKVTPVTGALDSGVVGPSRWRLFVTYHDAAWEPLRPQGDGQGEGWHYAHTTQAVWQSSKTAETVDSGEWGAPVRIKAERGSTDTTAFYLALSPQSKILETDSGGDLIAGQLPFTAQADLFKWNYKIPVIAGIRRFPGGGGNLFDPMPGDFYPVGRGLAFSLIDAPEGITVNEEGVITVAADAALEDEHSVTVQAAYQGGVYSAVLFIQVRKKGLGEAIYLGTVDTLPEGPYVIILKGPFPGRLRALQYNYVLAVAGGTVGSRIWKAGYVYQWTGVNWEERSPERYSDLYIRCFKDGLDAPGLAQDMGWFGALFARLLVVQQAFIETLAAQMIKLKNGGVIQSDNYSSEKGTGWLIDYLGNAYFNSGLIGGVDINAKSLKVEGKGYLPVGFIYFQLRGQPEPGAIFAGTWQNISSQYAGLFFRVEGGLAAAFGGDQGQAIQPHTHTYLKASGSLYPMPSGEMGNMTAVVQVRGDNDNTGSFGSTETRPVNTTIRVWKRTS